jgi:nucleoside-diphosphate-sugar epimerase
MTDLTASTGSPNVYINGGSTPLGWALLRLLVANGHRVAASVNGSAEAARARSMGVLPAFPDLTRAGELRSAIAAVNASVVINLAPTSPYQAPQFVKDWDAYTGIVEQGTRAALDAAKAAGADYFIQASYASLGGDAHDHGDHAAPDAAIIDAANAAEALVAAADIPYTILRFGFVYGSDSAALHTLRDALLRGRGFIGGSDHARANWIHAEDGARATLLAIAARPVGETLYVVDDKPVTPAAFVNTFASLLAVNAPAQPPTFARQFLAGASQLAMLEQPSGASNAETKTRLNWSPRYPTLDAGLEQALMVWRAEEPIKA